MSKLSFTIKEFLQALPNRNVEWDAENLSLSTVIEEVAFDTRRIHHPEKALFIALKGDSRDGHNYTQKAYQLGVRCFLVEKEIKLPGPANIIQVPSSLNSLQAFSRQYRLQFSYPIIGITGSNGKTIVKEWLASVLEADFRLVKSPLSYNSQIGVPFSLLEMEAGLDLAIIEAGISQAGKMSKLAELIQPEYGILTHFGDAHAEGFHSSSEKLAEKLLLFKTCKLIFVSADNPMVCATLEKAKIPFQSIGEHQDADFKVGNIHSKGEGWEFSILDNKGYSSSFYLSVSGRAALENALLVILTARYFEVSWDKIRNILGLLHPISMRTELITDNPEVAIINDVYNADRASVENAFSLLGNDQAHPGRVLILSDMEHQGEQQHAVQSGLLQTALNKFGAENIILIGPVFFQLAGLIKGLEAYLDIDDFLAEFDYAQFRNKTVLLKGARRYTLERIIPYLSRHATATSFKINLNHLVHNYRQFRAHVPASVKMMAMVKAFAYGAGTWEIAQTLEQEGIDYLGVAYTAEGIALRTKGIKVPIIVMNADPQSMEQLLQFQLEPNVYNMEFLRSYTEVGSQQGFPRLPIHIKVDTGMRRLGFGLEDLAVLNTFFEENPKIEVRSILSHLAAADEPKRDAFTHAQAQEFLAFRAQLQLSGDAEPLLHLLNTAGTLRFPEYYLDMVRLGIGLYGISMPAGIQLDLREIGSLHSSISQLQQYPAGTPIGYGCSEVTTRESRIAVVPIGYADGIRRSLSNGAGRFLVCGQRAPVIGRVCMDMLMLDVTDIPEAKTGDQVTLIGCQGKACISVSEIAACCNTIPYEILTGISQRVQRVYIKA